MFKCAFDRFRCANALEKYFQTRMKEVGLWDKWSSFNFDEFFMSEIKQLNKSSVVTVKSSSSNQYYGVEGNISNFAIFVNHERNKKYEVLEKAGPSDSVKISQTSGKRPVVKSSAFQGSVNLTDESFCMSNVDKKKSDLKFNIDDMWT